ncbi:hypothetical protein [Paraburkholderia sp. Ac-20340]|nr:hypothetical protein [Paraburkholderia sp. Ac-20340]
MQNTSPSDRAILDSWHRNAAPWIDAVREPVDPRSAKPASLVLIAQAA